MEKISLRHRLISLILIVAISTQTFGPLLLVVNALNEQNIKGEVENKRTGKIVKEIVEKRTKNEKHFLKDDGTFEVAIYPEDVHYLKDGKYVDINNTLVEEKGRSSQVYRNEDNDFHIEFEKEITNRKIYTIQKDAYELSYYLIDSTKTKSQKKEKLLKKSSSNLKELSNITDGILYENVFKNVNLQYTLKSNKIKEDIIVTDKISNNYFKFEVDLKNLVVEKKDKDIIFKDPKTKETIYIMSAPYMYDAKNEISTDVELNYEIKKDKIEITLTVDKKWMNDKSRVYPVTIDPVL